MSLCVASCQFPTSADVDANAGHVGALLREARARGARVAHFPEACLSGYAGADLESPTSIDFARLRMRTEELLALAGELGLWLVLGSTHPLTPPHKPHNSVYVVDDQGRLIDRYDKRFCAGDASEETGDLAHYTPGNHTTTFDVDGVRCGVLICHDYRYPELFRDAKRRGVQLMFHSFHAGHVPPERLARNREAIGEENLERSHGASFPEITMHATLVAVAASSHMWISAANSSARESCWGSFFVRADGVTTGRLDRHVTGMLISDVDVDAPLYESTAAWRDRAMEGRLHSGTLVADERSNNRSQL